MFYFSLVSELWDTFYFSSLIFYDSNFLLLLSEQYHDYFACYEKYYINPLKRSFCDTELHVNNSATDT